MTMSLISEQELHDHIHLEHYSHRMGWLRAAVLGANDGIISVASLLVGVIAAGASQENIILVAVSGLVAGALSMAAGEYVSVSSQSDSEQADMEKEKRLLSNDWEKEKLELTAIYVQRGVSETTAMQVATELMDHNALDAHLRDELGLHELHSANPLQAALASAAAFVAGSIIPVLVAAYMVSEHLGWMVAGISLTLLAILGAVSAKVGGANIIKGAFRVFFWGALAMALTTWVGYSFGAIH